jgi:hypothetical protein
MKKVKTFNIDTGLILWNSDITLSIPVSSKILGVFPYQNLLSFVCEFELHNEFNTELATFKIFSNNYIDEIIDDKFEFITTVFDASPSLITSTYNNNISLSLDNNMRKYYQIFRKFSENEVRDKKIDNIIDKK